MVAGLVVVGASAGGVEALRNLVAGFPVGLPAAVVVVLHIPRNAPSALPSILGRAGPLPAALAEHRARLRAGTVYVAPADRHVLVDDGRMVLSSGPTENGHRPAIDPLFRSAALAWGARAVGVVLSGTRDDGAAGLAAITARGGTALVQDPGEAVYPDMPVHAIEAVPDARVLPVAKVGAEITELLAAVGDLPLHPPPDELLVAETGIAALDPSVPDTPRLGPATPSPFSCPTCDGVLFEVPGHPSPRFRCRIGHAWSPVSLDAEQARAADSALWAALRVLEERAATLHRLADQAERRDKPRVVQSHRTRADTAARHAAVIRGLLSDGPEA